MTDNTVFLLVLARGFHFASHSPPAFPLPPPHKHNIINQTEMFGRNIQASVPRSRTLILQNRQFSVSSASNEGNNNSNDNDDKPSPSPSSPHNLPCNSLIHELRNRSPENTRRYFFAPARQPYRLLTTDPAPRDCLCGGFRT